jgi:hypothetical protein
MADERVVSAVKLVDPTTTSQQQSVSASGAALVDVQELPASAALADNTANPTTTLIGAMLHGFDGTTWDRIYTVADGDAVAAGTKGFIVLGTDGANYQVLKTDATGSLQVDIESSVALDTELPAAAALADNAANPTTPTVGAALLGFDGTNWDRIYTVADGDTVAAATKGFLVLGTDGTNYQVVKTDTAGELQVDVLTGGGTDTPTSPTRDNLTSAAVAAGATANLDSADLGGTTSKLWGVHISASVPTKYVIVDVENAVEGATYATGFGRAGEVVQWKAPHRDFANKTFAANAGFDGWRVKITNLDTSEAADVYSTIYRATN